MSSPMASRIESCALRSRDMALGRGAGLLHDDRGLDVPVRLLQQPVGVVVFHSGDDVDDAARSVLELFGSGVHVDHQVAVGLADLHHRAGGQHVQHELGGRALPSASLSRQ